MEDFSPLMNVGPVAIDNMINQFQKDPQVLDPQWRTFFEQLFLYEQEASAGGISNDKLQKEISVRLLIYAYRSRAHFKADTNPIRSRKDRDPYIDLKYFGLSEANYPDHFFAGKEIGMEGKTLLEIIERLRAIYTGHIGFEYNHIKNPDQRKWVRAVAERQDNKNYGFSKDQKLRLLSKVGRAVYYEEFFDKAFPAKKRFSLQGGEAFISGLDLLITTASDSGAEEIAIGMAHRGRLNVLAHTMEKPYELSLEEMNGHFRDEVEWGNGDVKYHKGRYANLTTANGKKVRAQLMFNPSHLEAVNPVTLGYCRARLDQFHGGAEGSGKIVPILVHGDAALAGQGIGYEVAQMSKLPGYDVGGVIHVVINNQLGFTTNFDEGRTSDYCTALAAVTNSPVLHVNGNDIEAVAYCMQTAMNYRTKFKQDVFVDIVCYRKWGHNEADAAEITQPELYPAMKDRETPATVYTNQLAAEGLITQDEAEKSRESFKQQLFDLNDKVKKNIEKGSFSKIAVETDSSWSKIESSQKASEDMVNASVKTGLALAAFRELIKKIETLPGQIEPVSSVSVAYKNQGKINNETPPKFRWGQSELAAYASLLQQGFSVRMTGQDVIRGTFGHRNLVVRDKKGNKEQTYNRLSPFETKDAKGHIYNSFLSEYAVLGFEYGYSLASPNDLVLWEAQFGDFANGAHTIIDQFITSAESKWLQRSGLVMLLPHGYEHQGPEHSSARIERFLQMAAESNIIVAVPSTPANMFHLLRRQMLATYRKPLIVMTPKSLFRAEACVSELSQYGPDTAFQTVIPDTQLKPGAAKRVLYCSGKMYYELFAARAAAKLENLIALVRIEQLYPLDFNAMHAARAIHPKAMHIWVQEEPGNMGAADFLDRRDNRAKFGFDAMISRSISASPACGSEYKSKHELEILLSEALDVPISAFKKEEEKH